MRASRRALCYEPLRVALLALSATSGAWADTAPPGETSDTRLSGAVADPAPPDPAEKEPTEQSLAAAADAHTEPCRDYLHLKPEFSMVGEFWRRSTANNDRLWPQGLGLRFQLPNWVRKLDENGRCLVYGATQDGLSIGYSVAPFQLIPRLHRLERTGALELLTRPNAWTIDIGWFARHWIWEPQPVGLGVEARAGVGFSSGAVVWYREEGGEAKSVELPWGAGAALGAGILIGFQGGFSIGGAVGILQTRGSVTTSFSASLAFSEDLRPTKTPP